MEDKSSKIINIFFFSSHACGKTSILNRIIYGKFIENCTNENKSYHCKLLSGDNFVELNFYEQSLEILNKMDIGENLIIFIYDLNLAKPFHSLNPIYEAIRNILADKCKNIKIGLIGNKLDLVSQNDLKTKKDIGENIAEKINGKFLMTSAKKGIGDVFQFILSIINSKSKNDIIIKNRKAIIKEYQQLFKSKNLNRVIRCEKCKTKIANIVFHDKSEKIEICCDKHPDEKFIYAYKDIINLIKKKCEICKKQFDEKSGDFLMYCKLCQHLICNRCLKKNEHKHEEKYNQTFISYYYEDDQLCNIHGIKNELFCLNCSLFVCSFCSSIEHQGHEILKNENKFIDNLIVEKRACLNKQKKQLENLKNYYTILINDITKLYNEFKEKMDLVLNLKENVLKQLEVIKYNNELYNTVLNMEFNEINVDFIIEENKSSVLDKLTIFFDCIEQPIRIVKYNICKEGKILKKYNLTRNDELSNYQSKPNLTGGCNIDGNLCCISFDDGNIYIYDKKDFKTCLKKHLLYENKRGVNSIINFKNENLIFTSGYEKIYQLKINKNLDIQKEVLIIHSNLTFITLCEYYYRKSIVYTDEAGNIGVYNISSKQEHKIKNDSENLEVNSIIELYNINENAFFMKYLSYELKFKLDQATRNSLAFNGRNSIINLERFSIMDATTSDANFDNKEKIKLLSKIFYVDDQNKIYNENFFSEKTNILGIINKELIIIQEQKEEQIKCKILNLVTNKELDFGRLMSGIQKEWSFKLIGENPDNGKIYFVLVDHNFDLLEYSYHLQSNEIEEIGLLRKITKENPKEDNNIIVKIILMKSNFILIKNNGELYIMNY